MLIDATLLFKSNIYWSLLFEHLLRYCELVHNLASHRQFKISKKYIFGNYYFFFFWNDIWLLRHYFFWFLCQYTYGGWEGNMRGVSLIAIGVCSKEHFLDFDMRN